MKPSGKEASSLRLQTFLSRNGVTSRRKAMDLVKSGRVLVNGEVVREPSTPVDSTIDHIVVDGREISKKAYDYILLNKPAGYVTTKSDPFAEKTVLDLLPSKYKHLFPVGRLDKDTEGLLLLTNDGDLTFILTHPKHNIDKIYFARVNGRLENQEKQKIEQGVILEGKKTAPAAIENIKDLTDATELTIKIHEGRKRQIRLMFEVVGHKVVYLKRLTQGPIELGNLEKGKWRNLTPREIEILKGL